MSAMVMKGLEGSTRVDIRIEFDPTSLSAAEARQLAARVQRALTEILKQSSAQPSQAGEAGDREASVARVDGQPPPDRVLSPPPPVSPTATHVGRNDRNISATFPNDVPSATAGTTLPKNDSIFPRHEPKKPFGEFMNKKFDPDQARAAAAEALHAHRIDL